MQPPIIVLESGDVYAFRTIESAELSLEPIDIENEEYEIFDSEGLRLYATVINHQTPIKLKRSDPPQKDPEYLRIELLDFLQRCGEGINQWENASLVQVVEKIVADYPSK